MSHLYLMGRFSFWNRSRKPDQPANGGQAGLLSGDPVKDEHFVNILLESIADVSSSMDLAQVLQAIVGKSLEVTQAERAIVFLGSDSTEFEIKVARDREGTELGKDLLYSRSVVRRCAEERHPVRSVVQSDQEALELGQSVFDLKLRAVMCAPLMARDRFLGAIYVDSRAARREFSARDLALFGALTTQLSVAVDYARLHADSIEKVRLEKDVEIARRIQQHLLPSVPKAIGGLDVALRYRACGRASGDAYDFMQVEGGKLVAMVADVTGHGVGAALLTHSAQAGLRSYLELIDDLGVVVTRLNNRLVAGVETGNFMSLLLVSIDPRSRALHYVNGGHPELWIVRQSGVQAAGKTGMVLGVVGDTNYSVGGPIELSPGDVVFLRSDGIEEAMDPNHEVFGEARLRAVLTAARSRPAERILAEVEQELRRHTGEGSPQDDVTMIAIKVVGS